MKAIVDKDICIGCGLCIGTCPEVFTMDDDDKAVALNGEVPDDSRDSAQEARDGCPVDAISIED